MTEDINVRRLQTPQRAERKELPFDAEKHLTKKGWDGMRRMIRDYRLREEWTEYCQLAANVRILDPLHAPTLPKSDFKILAERVDGFRDADQEITFSIAADMKIAGMPYLSPAAAAAIRSQLESLGRSLQNKTASAIDVGRMRILAHIKVLDPAAFAKIKLDSTFWDNADWLLQTRREFALMGSAQTGTVDELAIFLRDIKILDPKRTKVTKDEWDLLHARLEIFKEKELWFLFSRLAAQMKILAADDVKIANDGLEFITLNKTADDENKRPVPEASEI